MSDPRLHAHPDLPEDAAAAISHLKPPVVPDHVKNFAQGRPNVGRLAHQQKLAAIGLLLKHVRRQLERLGATVTLSKTDNGITFQVDYPTVTGSSPAAPPLDDFSVGG